MSEKLTDAQLKAAIHEAAKKFRGQIPTLESAIGALFVGKAYGWDVLLIVHNRTTIKKYEKLLDIDFRAQMDATTELSRKSYGWVFAQKTKAFWKLVRGEVSHQKRTEVAEGNVSERAAVKTQNSEDIK